MAKLYWRVKKDGKWTWTPVTDYKLAIEKLKELDSADEAIHRAYVESLEE